MGISERRIKDHRTKYLSKVNNPYDDDYRPFVADNGAILAMDEEELLAIVGRFEVTKEGVLLAWLEIRSYHREKWETLLEIRYRNIGFDRYLSIGFGYSPDGTQVILGDPFNSDNAEEAGAAYILTLEDDRWDLSHILYEENPTAFAHFGDSALLAGNKAYALVGKGNPFNKEPSCEVAIYRRMPNDDWTPISESDRATVVYKNGVIDLTTIDPCVIE